MDLSMVSFSSARLSLASFTPRDASEAFDVATPTVARYMKWDPAPTSAEYEKTWREWLPKMAAGTDAYLVIRLGRNGEFLGLAGLHKIDTAELFVGIWIKEARQGEGYGREAVSALISFASRVLGKSRLVYPVAVENRASRRVAEKLGGTIAGTWTLRKRGGIELPALTYSIAAGSQPE